MKRNIIPAEVIAVLVVLQALLVIVHLTVYKTMDAAFGIGSVPLEVLFVALALTFTASSVIIRFRDNRAATWFYVASSYWFGLINFLFMGAFTFFVVERILDAFNYYISPALVGGICFGAFFLVHLYGTWESNRVKVTRVNVPLHGVSEFWKKNKLVFISDLHLGSVRRAAFAAKVARKIRELHPAMVAIGGDLFDGPKCDPDALLAPFRSLHAPLGTCFITGNHEYFGDMPAFLAAIRKAGIRILDNEKMDVEGMAFVGVDQRSLHDEATYAEALRKAGVDRAMPNILLAHEPARLDVPEAAGIAAAFFGHTHYGQIFPLSFFTKQIYHGFDYGLKRFRAMWVYTSSGVGTWGPPLRLGTKSEIVFVSFVEKA